MAMEKGNNGRTADGCPSSYEAGNVRPHFSQRPLPLTKRRRMLRRAKFIAIGGISGLCMLLLIATSQNRLVPQSMPRQVSPQVFGYDALTVSLMSSVADRQHQRPDRSGATSAATINMTQREAMVIQRELHKQRQRIKAEMSDYQYVGNRTDINIENLTDLVPEMGGTPMRSIIVTTWRSGSTFLGDILNALPGNYYHYEPLLDFGILRIHGENESLAITKLRNLLNCNYTDMHNYLEYASTHDYVMGHNDRLWRVCDNSPLCFNANFLTPYCRLFPLQSMKTVRLPLYVAEKLLEDTSLNVRILLLVRDPRGTMQSRKHRTWCPTNPDCENPRNLCNELVAEYYTAEELKRKYPLRFRTVRYEDLSLNPYNMTKELLDFFALPFDLKVRKFLDSHTKKNVGGVSSTYRDSKQAPFHWAHDLNNREIIRIESVCKEAMQLWDYELFDNFNRTLKIYDLYKAASRTAA